MALVIRNENFVDWMQYWPAGEPVIVQRVATPERGAGRGGGGVPRDYRSLWRTAIRQTVLLGRMERENARRDRAEEERAERRLKLGYTELGGGPGWEAALAGLGEELQPRANDVELGSLHNKDGIRNSFQIPTENLANLCNSGKLSG